ncbi:hypothetical protein L3C95_09940 [Chitinophaga filiformis]|uniref:hypothetical protein n=1 Tax=Chitinophaga filiformis TaxID=104663 RepID=UPI001F3015E3|nr:hypothetical protein [Chitinophaga filiformis]MCF6402886.1 hypothetical protein [Chitinophaga filiformis]MCF6403196.1 hypothetical protein [Chitinophaga filiformis]
MIFQSFLLLHLVGLVLFAGTTTADFVSFRQFWKQYALDAIAARPMLQSMIKFPLLMGLGMAAIILSGVGMMAMTHGVFGEQLWFRIKFAIVVLIILNNIIIGRRLVISLRKRMTEVTSEAGETLQIKHKLRLFHYAQLLMFFVIILLSVFKFN